jgi:hypothetical protein
MELCQGDPFSTVYTPGYAVLLTWEKQKTKNYLWSLPVMMETVTAW